MLKKTSESGQLNIFTLPKSLFAGNSLKMFEDKQAWHNQFRKQVTMWIDIQNITYIFIFNKCLLSNSAISFQ